MKSPLHLHAIDKAKVLKRVIAKIVDIFIFVAIAAILPYPLGPLLGFFYTLCGDGIQSGGFQGQSIGKRIMGLRVIRLADGKTATMKDSAYRNAPVGVATFFALIPIWGWLILGLIGIPLMVMEIYLMLTVATSHRLGDVMADTEVIETRPR